MGYVMPPGPPADAPLEVQAAYRRHLLMAYLGSWPGGRGHAPDIWRAANMSDEEIMDSKLEDFGIKPRKSWRERRRERKRGGEV